MDQKLNIRLDIIKLLEENTGRTLWHKLQQDLFELTFQSNENKNKNKQMGLKLKSFRTAKETINRKTIHKIGENICKQSDWQGINLQNRHKTVHEALGRKTTQSKNRQKIRRFRKEDIQMAKKHMKRYSTSLNIREKESQIQWPITSHQSEWPSSKPMQTIHRELCTVLCDDAEEWSRPGGWGGLEGGIYIHIWSWPIFTDVRQRSPQHCKTMLQLKKSKKYANSKCWRGWGEKGILLHCWQECKLV